MSRNLITSWAGLLIASGWLSFAISATAGTPVDARFQETIFASDSANLSSPVRLAWAPDGSGRLFVIRYHGKVQIIQNGQLLPEPFATMDPIYANGECGLLGICFDPNFASNRYVYFFVSVSRSEQQIVRYTDSNNFGIDRTVIIDGLPTLGNQHNGGAIAIGPDGKLYWAIGDIGDRVGVKDDLTTLASKIGRANLDGTVPNDNPFIDGPGPNNDYIWARGFRNPFEMTFQPGTGALWVNVVGHVYEQIFVVPRGGYGGWDEYERNHPDGVLKPVIKYRTNRTDRRNVAPDGAVRQNNIVTITTADPHGFLNGEKITIGDATGALSSSFYGTFTIAVVSPMSFTFIQPGPDETSGGGKAETMLQGGSVTGGAFYNSSAFPSEFFGNYFYGDFNSGDLMRAVIGADGQIASIDYLVRGIDQLVDVVTGPDGALYYIGHNGQGNVYRLAYAESTSQVGFIVEPSVLSMLEGGVATFTIRLSQAPASPVAIDVSRISGSENISVAGATQLLFDDTNWAVPQSVTVTADSIPDGLPSAAAFSVTAPGMASRRIDVTATDVPGAALEISTAALQLREGGAATFTVQLSAAPESDVLAELAISGGGGALAISSSTTLGFNSSNYNVPQTVSLSGVEDNNLLNETVIVTVTAPGKSPRNVQVTVIDNDPIPPSILSAPPNAAVSGSPFVYPIQARGNPVPAFSLVSGPEGMTVDSSSGLVSWPAPVIGEFNVSVRAANGVLPEATQTFVLTVRPDAPPVAVITKPRDGEVVSGSATEWFGDGIDDVGLVQAEFSVDGVLHYTDINNTGHYHFGGEHLRWDTTVLGNGAHRLKFVVRDTKGQVGVAEINVTVANQPVGVGYEADVSPRPSGSGDGIVEIADWVQVGRFVAGLDSIESSSEFQRADCAPTDPIPPGDGVLSVADWVQAGRYAAGLDAAVAAGGPTEPVAGAQSARSLGPTAVRQLRATALELTSNNELGWMPIELTSTGNENGIGFSVAFDPQQLRYAGARLRTADAILQSNIDGAAEGSLGFVVVLPAGRTFAAGETDLIELGFSAIDHSPGFSSILLTDAPVRREISDAHARPLAAGFGSGTVRITPPGPRIAAAIDESGGVRIFATGEPGTRWLVKFSDDLTSWTVLAEITIDADGTAQTGDSSPLIGSRFYRFASP